MTIPLIETGGQQTNFGSWWWECVKELRGHYGKHWLPVSNGTSAITLAAQTTFRRGSRVAVPDYTMVATLHGIVAAGCIPVILPCDPDTGMMNVETLRQQYHWGMLQGAVIVSPFGAAFDHLPFEEIDCDLVYDLAGAWPMQIQTDYPCTYSCHATKNISVREGGMVAFSRECDWEKARRLSAFDIGPTRESASIYAWNCKLDEQRSKELFFKVVRDGCEHLQILERIDRKRELLDFYASELPMIEPLKGLREGFPSLCVFRVPDAAKLEAAGAVAGITFKRYYHPILSDMPFSAKLDTVSQADPRLRQFIAFPSDASSAQAEQVVRFVKGVFE